MASWTSLGGIPQIVVVWRLVPICILWCLLRSEMIGRSKTMKQNDRMFEDSEHSLEEIRPFFFFVRT